MLFNSFDFAVFLPLVFLLYWFVFQKNIRIQNLLVAVASYVFYGWWDWRFLFLLLFSSVVDFTIGRRMDRTADEKSRKQLLYLSLVVNLGLLGFFKYYNFFVDSFAQTFTFFGMSLDSWTLDIILPVGISFYTFQTLSYTIDVYRGNLKPTDDFVAFSAFVSFFPQLVAGPIERATNLLPQFHRERTFDYGLAVNGMRQILWGMFKKVVVADNCALFVTDIFGNNADYSGSTLVLGAVFFAIQIYCDFSGYSDIAIGVARLFGFDLMRNFAYPYFSRDIGEFWRRWHISLSTWFRDYLYIPLGGSRGSTAMKVRNTFIIFVVSGFWHGANWTFVIWGALNALYFLPLLLFDRNRRNLDTVAEGRWLPSLRETWGMASTFALTVLAWVFFRADNLSHAIEYLSGMFSSSLFSTVRFKTLSADNLLVIPFILLLFGIEWWAREDQFGLERFGLGWWRPLRWAFYFVLMTSIIVLSQVQQQFIYFQF